MMSEFDKYWLAGYLEGEGSFLKGPPSSPNIPIIAVCSTDEDVIAHVALIFEVKYHRVKKTKNPKHKQVWAVKKNGRIAIEMMKLIRPYMSKRRQNQIDAAIASYKPEGIRLIDAEIEQIKQLAKAEPKLTQKQIAKMFGIRREWVNKIINNKDGRKILV